MRTRHQVAVEGELFVSEVEVGGVDDCVVVACKRVQFRRLGPSEVVGQVHSEEVRNGDALVTDRKDRNDRLVSVEVERRVGTRVLGVVVHAEKVVRKRRDTVVEVAVFRIIAI